MHAEDPQGVNREIFFSLALFVFGSGLLNSTKTPALVTTTVSKYRTDVPSAI